MYKITIIIPVYNAEKYLRQLLDSIINQTMDYRELQVIMVDDLSKDASREIMKEYSNQYDNFVSIELSKNNKIAGKARNEGLKRAQGKYLMFADSDDFYMPNACETMYKTIEEKQADFVTANYINAEQNGTLWSIPIFDLDKYPSFKLDIKDYDKSFFILSSSVCNKIFRRQFVEENGIYFLEGTPAEDAFFTTSCFLKTDRVYYNNSIIYCYRQRNGTPELNSVSFYCSKRYFDRLNKAYYAIYENFMKSGHVNFYRYTYAKNMSYMLYKFIDSPILTKEDRISILKQMRWFYKLSVELKVPAAQTCQNMIIEKILQEDYEEAVNYCTLVADIRSYLPKEIKEGMSRPDAQMYSQIAKYNAEFQS